MEKLKELVEKEIGCIEESGIDQNNIDVIYKLVDIHKDIANEEYWETKKEAYKMRYEDEEYGYGARRRDSRGRYMAGGYMAGRGGYNARGGRGNYRGEEKLEDMHEMYQNYSEAKEEYNRGNYGAGAETMKSFEYMLKSFKDFFKHLEKEADSEEEVQMLKETAREIAGM